jgi:amino acid adenylation domain-containing protein
MTLPYFKSIVPPGDFAPLTRADLAGSIPDRFNEISAHNPQKTAVCDHVKSLTYLELQHLVNKAAATIRRAMEPAASAKGVGLIFDPTVESVVGILGVLASGNFFCPISPHDPLARVKSYLEDAEINVILTTREAFPDRLQSELQSEQVVFVDQLAENDVETITPATLDPDQLAAILYTSGSTGMPKGVTHTHKTLMDMVRIKGNELGISPSDRIAGLSTFTFGSYYWNVFATVLSGATLHFYDFYRFPFENLESWLIDRRITHFHCTPTTLRQFLAALGEPTVLADLRLVSLGGEPVYPNDVYQFQRKLSQATALCTTGATIETWFYAHTFFQIPFPDGIAQIPMGFIHPECSVEVRDDQGGKLPPGQTGEIAVSSQCLSPGYWKRAKLNAAKYLVGEDQKRYFRSGDLGTLTPDGLLYQKGRSDFQVKVRGKRVDLADIEAVLHGHPGVKQAVVVGRSGKDNHMELVAYIVATGHRTTGRSEIYRFLAAKLSPDQIPARLVFLESFPLTHTHKVDRKALPDPDEIETTRDPQWIEPRNDVEALLHGIWAEILGHENFGVTEPFLELGGDSLGAIRLRNQVEAELGVSIPLRDLLTTATIESLANLVHHPGTEPVTTRPSDHLNQDTRP